jgi:hypothetical protein
MTGAERPRGTLAVHVDPARPPLDLVPLDLAGVVRDVEQERQRRVVEEAGE